MIGVVTATAGGRAGAAALQAAWPEEVRLFTEQERNERGVEKWALKPPSGSPRPGR